MLHEGDSSTPIDVSLPNICQLRPPPPSTLFPYTTLFRSLEAEARAARRPAQRAADFGHDAGTEGRDLERDRNRSEEHTSELQSRFDLVCRLLLEKKKSLLTT